MIDFNNIRFSTKKVFHDEELTGTIELAFSLILSGEELRSSRIALMDLAKSRLREQLYHVVYGELVDAQHRLCLTIHNAFMSQDHVAVDVAFKEFNDKLRLK